VKKLRKVIKILIISVRQKKSDWLLWIEEIESEGDEVLYSGTVKIAMTMNQEKVAILKKIDKWLQESHERIYIYADRVDHYMIMPASWDADNKVKDKLQQ